MPPRRICTDTVYSLSGSPRSTRGHESTHRLVFNIGLVHCLDNAYPLYPTNLVLDGFKGDIYLLLKLLLPGVVKIVYNLNSKQLVKIFSQVYCLSLDM